MSDLRAMFACLSLFDDGSLLAELQGESGTTFDFGLNNNGVLCFQGRIYVPNDSDLRQSILREVHSSPYVMHPGGTDFVTQCLTCQQVKNKYQLPSGLLQPVKIPLWKYERVTIGFINKLPLTPTKKDSVWTDYSLQKLAKLYISEIMKLYGTDGQSERVIQILKDMLRSCVINFRGSEKDYLQLAEFAYNNNFQSNIQMAPYEALYGCKCRTSLY
ncbi:uncharacterized protein LOC128283863 [Gossypium arboreum]|uniref:uncharacterized protein LOC128283863 n=1 Tax=Gossypium arboreum TaxID=29729 RepID=UPI0022F18C14|nr:uncharacterized protein LOC128283863 [Gossypium arboreum]